MKAQTAIWTFEVLDRVYRPGITVLYVTDSSIGDKPTASQNEDSDQVDQGREH